MKLLFLLNVPLPIISKSLGLQQTPFGGWITGFFDSLLKNDKYKLFVCFPTNSEHISNSISNNLKYFSFNPSYDDSEYFNTILSEVNPDIIHIFGTEYKHSYDMVMAASQLNIIDRVVINIQGLVSICGKYHYYCDLPDSIVNRKYFQCYRKISSIKKDCRSFTDRGFYEIEALKRVNHVVGRTDWDEACVKQINPDINYHFCNENLRESFYNCEWDYKKCEKHSIFVSQSNYPIKGFHHVLEAMPEIIKRFPDAHLYTTGIKPRYPKKLKHKISQDSYSVYISKLINKYNLEKHITFLGTLDEESMCKQYLKSNVFVSASSIENSPNSVCEAMILGMPVVTSDVGGVKNLISHNSEGYIYQHDAPYMLSYYVCKIFENPEQAIAMGQRAKLCAEKTHDRKLNTETMMKIYNKVTNKE